MVLISAFKKYFALDSKQKEFIKSGQRIFLLPPAQIIKILQPLASFDKDCDDARSQCGKLMLFIFLGGFVFLLIGASESINIPAPVLSGVVFFLVSAFLILLVAYLVLKSIDIHNNLREFVVPMLNTISQDMNQADKIRLKIDLRGKCISAKQTKVENHDPGWFCYPKTTRTFYKDNWLDASATLCDGSKLFFSVTDFVTQTCRKKKNPRGKIKHKTKYKVKHRIKAGLSLKNKSYRIDFAPSEKDMDERVKQKQGNRRNVVSLTKVIFADNVDTTLDPGSMLALIGKILMHSKPVAKEG